MRRIVAFESEEVRLGRFGMKRAILLFPIVALISISPLAFASPPDASWICGIYDGDDGDDVVSLVYDGAAIEAAPSPPASQLHRLTQMSTGLRTGVVHVFFSRQFSRGPPSAVSVTCTTSTLQAPNIVDSSLSGKPRPRFQIGPDGEHACLLKMVVVGVRRCRALASRDFHGIPLPTEIRHGPLGPDVYDPLKHRRTLAAEAASPSLAAQAPDAPAELIDPETTPMPLEGAIWFFVWVLETGAFQVSDPHPSQEACEQQRALVEETKRDPLWSRPVEHTRPCLAADH